MYSFLISVREAPLQFLPVPSLKSFFHFRGGYSHRFAVEGRSMNWQYNRREFHDWLCKRYRLIGAESLADTTIVTLFSDSEGEGFQAYFDLLEEYLQSAVTVEQKPVRSIEKKDFSQMLIAIRQSPALYLGSPTFLGCCSFLKGDEQAHLELGLPRDEGREVFRGFQEWVEQEKNQAGQKRPWFKIIEFWSAGIDCGHTASGAWSLFWKWLDQYTKLVGREDLFGVPNDSPKASKTGPVARSSAAKSSPEP